MSVPAIERALKRLKITSKTVEEIASQRRSKDRAKFWKEVVRTVEQDMCLFVDEVCNAKKERKRGRAFRGEKVQKRASLIKHERWQSLAAFNSTHGFVGAL
eukprot:TRINITY_DN12281_c0_g1_i14.p2 TRINITY_DN12281_c0_g1~~TRINITY_DN12281_c0_g1_i14.p2  ORF type:complete len:101 (+),score=15.63 TRINITY_DN12281_c0_g1_i14:165-467(+)